MGGLKPLQLRVGTMANFVYLLVDEESREALVVDSGWETRPIVQAVKAERARVKYAVATHEHFDHTSTLRELATEIGAKVVAHSASPVDHDVSVEDGEELMLGGRRVKVLHTPGHTQDSICLYDGTEVFTGDTLFVGTIGRFDAKSAGAMYNSLYNVILKLPEATVVYPGHDYGEVSSRSLGEERLRNPFLRSKDVRSFLSVSD
ncbi:MAG: MBL fold metallo-hydrolase [Nitrososphaerales archaeon]|nr:MBL fold metallo-hydrolase [Nitrososphaerales archaeon]